MIPSKSDGRWAKLVKGEVEHSFKSVPAGLMMSRMRRETQANPDTSTLKRCIDEAYLFFEKYEPILSDDITRIFGKEA
jgi:hypothetical protein